MAKFEIKGLDDLSLRLSRLENGSEKIAGKALYSGAKIVANQVKKNIHGLPVEKPFKASPENKLRSISQQQKDDLVSSFGITPMGQKDGNYDVKLGFDGYGTGRKTKKYPKGLPNQVLGRSVESGTSFRIKRPFVRPAINATKKSAVEAMSKAAHAEIDAILKG